MDEVAMSYTTANNIEAARWKKIYEFTCACGKAHNPKDLVIEILNRIGGLCAFDQALAYFIDGNKKICGQYLMNIDKRWSSMYLGYYASADNQKFSYDMNVREDPNKITLNVLDWENEPSEDFVPNYIRLRGLKYSCGFALFDLNGNYRTIISLDRVEKKEFSHDELINLNLAIPQLNHLHKNFYYQWFRLNTLKRATLETENLTAREAEIADLLCQGVSPTHISRTLHITPSTAHKHMSHIYEKLHVSSERELLARLLRQPIDPSPE
jgi:DNA-binding CsgD family transcriptional regulator